MNIRFFLLFLIFLCIFNISCSFKKGFEQNSDTNSLQSQLESKNEALSQIDELSKEEAVIRTAKGNLIIKFYENAAPNTVTRIKELITSGFYDGLIFHRVVPNFVIQTGDPTQTGSGGSGKKLKAEFSSLKHKKGTVAMARTQDVDSADSQFYIALTDLPQLDGQYTIFGQVVSGENILSQIIKGDKIISMSLRDDK